ncbi:MAG: endonuclease [Bacteroidetes bacterium]|nr:endonuclease [Bacteroidota bacterium]
MAEHNELGKKGEEMAKEYLIQKGYKILETNWRQGSYEIDIIASFKSFLVIAEVKTRCSNAFGEPEEFVNKQKQKFLIKAAGMYISRNNIVEEVRFDIISILTSGNNWKINHIEDAFYPTLY